MILKNCKIKSRLFGTGYCRTPWRRHPNGKMFAYAAFPGFGCQLVHRSELEPLGLLDTFSMN